MVCEQQSNWQECVKPISATNGAANISRDTTKHLTESRATPCERTSDISNATAACGMPQVARAVAVYCKYPLKQPTFVTALRSTRQSCDYVNLSMSLTLALAPRRYQLPPHRPSRTHLAHLPTKRSSLVRLHLVIATGQRMLWTHTHTQAVACRPIECVKQQSKCRRVIIFQLLKLTFITCSHDEPLTDVLTV